MCSCIEHIVIVHRCGLIIKHDSGRLFFINPNAIAISTRTAPVVSEGGEAEWDCTQVLRSAYWIQEVPDNLNKHSFR